MMNRILSNSFYLFALLVFIRVASTRADECKMSSFAPLQNVGADELRKTESTLVSPLHQFSGNLFRSLKQDKKNVVFSPLSIHSALNLLLLGADDGSQTEKELTNVLGYMNSSTSTYHDSYSKLLSIMKDITESSRRNQQKEPSQSDDKPLVLDFWTQGIVKKGIVLKPGYVDAVQKYYNSTIKQTGDSESNQKLVDEINKWAKDAGYQNGVIQKSELEENFSILLMSAVKVEAHWFEEFYEYEVDELFYNHGLKDQLVKNSTGMTVRDVTGRFFEFTKNKASIHHNVNSIVESSNCKLYHELAELEFRVIQLPLNGDVTFTIFEPLTTSTGQELGELEKQLLAVDPKSKQSKLEETLWLIDNQKVKQDIEFLQMPKFKFESDIDLKPQLESIGVKRAFSGDADLNKIAAGKQHVSGAKHQAMIEVNKSGIKAAGITKIHVMLLSLKISSHPIKLHVKNPFMFVIRYSRYPLFMGHLVNIP